MVINAVAPKDTICITITITVSMSMNVLPVRVEVAAIVLIHQEVIVADVQMAINLIPRLIFVCRYGLLMRLLILFRHMGVVNESDYVRHLHLIHIKQILY